MPSQPSTVAAATEVAGTAVSEVTGVAASVAANMALSAAGNAAVSIAVAMTTSVPTSTAGTLRISQIANAISGRAVVGAMTGMTAVMDGGGWSTVIGISIRDRSIPIRLIFRRYEGATCTARADRCLQAQNRSIPGGCHPMRRGHCLNFHTRSRLDRNVPHRGAEIGSAVDDGSNSCSASVWQPFR